MLPAVPAVAQTITTAAIEADETAPMIVTITGAPGDGNTALAAAIRNELARVGWPFRTKLVGRSIAWTFMSRLATRETTATSRSRSNGGCEIQRAKTKAPSCNASSFPKES